MCCTNNNDEANHSVTPLNSMTQSINLSHLRAMTIEYSEHWGYPHVGRVLRLIKEIGTGMDYNENVILYATYLHDWGAFPRFAQAGVDHALRSMQIAESEILPYTCLTPDARQAVLDAIALHDYRDPRPAVPVEALLLREADMLEFLGVIGIVRDFSRRSNDLRAAYELVLSRRADIAGRLTLPRAQAIAEQRIASMDRMLELLKEESFECL